jgi:hypothetical protein
MYVYTCMYICYFFVCVLVWCVCISATFTQAHTHNQASTHTSPRTATPTPIVFYVHVRGLAPHATLPVSRQGTINALLMLYVRPYEGSLKELRMT